MGRFPNVGGSRTIGQGNCLKISHIHAGVLGTFGLLIVLMVGLGLFNLVEADRVDRAFQRLAETQWHKTQLATQALEISSRNSRVTMEIFLQSDPRIISQLLLQRQTNSERIRVMLGELRPLVGEREERQLLDRIVAARRIYMASYLASLDRLVRQQRAAEGRAMMIQDTLPKLEAYHQAWQDFMAREDQQISAMSRTEAVDYAASRRRNLLVLLAGLALSAGFLGLVLWQWREEQRRAQAHTQALEVAQLDLERKIRERTAQLLETNQALEATAGKLSQANLELQTAVFEARELARQADQANAAKSAFLANMSHEIRTPLNGIMGMAYLLLDEEQPVGQREMTTIITHSSEHLLNLINALLDLARIEANQLELETAPFDLPQLVTEVVQPFQPQARSKQIQLAASLAEDLPVMVVGDVQRLRQILLNLAGNGLKFTDKGSVTIRVECLAQDERQARLRFSVTDTGLGIDPAVQPKLFKAFAQADVSTTRKYGGSGLGLAICKHLVELMKGRMGLESALGKGSTFWFEIELPKAAVGGTP